MTYPSSYYVFLSGGLLSLALNITASAYVGPPASDVVVLLVSILLLVLAALGLFVFGEYVRDLSSFLIRSDGQLDKLVSDPLFLYNFPVKTRNRTMRLAALSLTAGLVGIGLLPVRSELFLRQPKAVKPACASIAQSGTTVVTSPPGKRSCVPEPG
jgi:hypothetical protein